jgi:hypothetical protein
MDNLPDNIKRIKVLTPDKLEIALLKKDLEFWRNSANLNIIIKQSERIKELEEQIKQLNKK